MGGGDLEGRTRGGVELAGDEEAVVLEVPGARDRRGARGRMEGRG